MTSQQAGAETWTAVSLILIAIGVLLVIVMIGWGARLKRQRQAAEEAIEDRAESAAPPVAAPRPAKSLDDMPPAAPETDPVPVAPPPPPLADTPVVAAAPFDAGPAAVAADLATPPAPPETSGADDLTVLKGVGPKLAARLGELGITRFAQIAALSPTEADALDAKLGSFQGRMARDRWVEQSGYLANGDRAGFEAAFGKL